MPRPRKTGEDKRAEIFIRLYKIGKAATGFQEPDVSRAISITERTLLEKKKNPGKFSVDQFVTLGRVFDWSDEEFLQASGWRR